MRGISFNEENLRRACILWLIERLVTQQDICPKRAITKQGIREPADLSLSQGDT